MHVNGKAALECRNLFTAEDARQQGAALCAPSRVGACLLRAGGGRGPLSCSLVAERVCVHGFSPTKFSRWIQGTINFQLIGRVFVVNTSKFNLKFEINLTKLYLIPAQACC
jgi:hypothetical protein